MPDLMVSGRQYLVLPSLGHSFLLVIPFILISTTIDIVMALLAWSSTHVLPGSPQWTCKYPWAMYVPWYLSGMRYKYNDSVIKGVAIWFMPSSSWWLGIWGEYFGVLFWFLFAKISTIRHLKLLSEPTSLLLQTMRFIANQHLDFDH